MDAPSTPFRLFVPVFRAGARIGDEIAIIGKWRILDCTTLGRADGQSAKWTDAASVDHFPDCARHNLEPICTKPNSKPSMLPKARSRVATGTPDKPASYAKTSTRGTRLHAASHNTNRVSDTAQRDIKSSDAQAPNLWTAKYQ